ncbi:MAG: hypothetical protein LBN40_00380 [Oscillospiraceae bacterium]|jgi:Holliday junction resolvase|nr:hypothetical protein [Oscillospiraceae bacterium]
MKFADFRQWQKLTQRQALPTAVYRRVAEGFVNRLAASCGNFKGGALVNNKKLGNDFEAQLCEILFEEGFWCHNLAQNQAGQPADVIAVKNGKAYLIDCKVCSTSRFALSRMEDNQDLSMEHWKDCGNDDGWFAILLRNNAIHMIPHFAVREMAKRRSSIGEQEICDKTLSLVEWLKLT